MNPMSSASEITANEAIFYNSMPNPTIIHHESEGVSTELKLGYDSCITRKRSSSEDLANLSLSEEARAIKRLKLEEVEEPNGVSLELKLGPWDIRKQITFSDIDRDQSRLLLPAGLVKKHILPHWDVKKIKNGAQVSVWDFDTESEHQLQFKQWSSSYVFISGWNEKFVKERVLKVGDEIGLYWDRSKSKFIFSILRRASSS